jgi:hypothetical protein
MTSELFAFAASFVLVGLATSIVPGCIRDDGCVDIPDRPAPAGPISNLKIIGYDDTLIEAPLAITPENATLEVTGEKVVILYSQGKVNFRVEYQVTGPYY